MSTQLPATWTTTQHLPLTSRPEYFQLMASMRRSRHIDEGACVDSRSGLSGRKFAAQMSFWSIAKESTRHPPVPGMRIACRVREVSRIAEVIPWHLQFPAQKTESLQGSSRKRSGPKDARLCDRAKMGVPTMVPEARLGKTIIPTRKRGRLHASSL